MRLSGVLHPHCTCLSTWVLHNGCAALFLLHVLPRAHTHMHARPQLPAILPIAAGISLSEHASTWECAPPPPPPPPSVPSYITTQAQTPFSSCCDVQSTQALSVVFVHLLQSHPKSSPHLPGVCLFASLLFSVPPPLTRLLSFSMQEMIIDKVNGQPVPRYLIYDIIKFNVSSRGRLRVSCLPLDPPPPPLKMCRIQISDRINKRHLVGSGWVSSRQPHSAPPGSAVCAQGRQRFVSLDARARSTTLLDPHALSHTGLDHNMESELSATHTEYL